VAELAETNLVLCGTKETNSVMTGLGAAVSHRTERKGHRLRVLFIAPVTQHYLLVYPGLPWWTCANQVKWPGIRLVSAPTGILCQFGADLLFWGSLENILRRSPLRWALEIAARVAVKMRSGAVIK